MQTFSLILLFNVAFILPAKSQAFGEGKNFVSGGYGFGTFLAVFDSYFSDYTNIRTSLVGPINIKFEHGVTEHIGIGVNLSYLSNSWNYDVPDSLYMYPFSTTSYTETTKYSTISFLVRLNYHFGANAKFDPYVGLGLGYRSQNISQSTTNPNGHVKVILPIPFPFGFETTIGARYMMAPGFGFYAEAGIAKSVMQVGITAGF